MTDNLATATSLTGVGQPERHYTKQRSQEHSWRMMEAWDWL